MAALQWIFLVTACVKQFGAMVWVVVLYMRAALARQPFSRMILATRLRPTAWPSLRRRRVMRSEPMRLCSASKTYLICSANCALLRARSLGA